MDAISGTKVTGHRLRRHLIVIDDTPLAVAVSTLLYASSEYYIA